MYNFVQLLFLYTLFLSILCNEHKKMTTFNLHDVIALWTYLTTYKDTNTLVKSVHYQIYGAKSSYWGWKDTLGADILRELQNEIRTNINKHSVPLKFRSGIKVFLIDFHFIFSSRHYFVFKIFQHLKLTFIFSLSS